MTNPDATVNLISRTRKCPEHGHGLRLCQHDEPFGVVRYWVCPEVNCWYVRPCKYGASSRRVRHAIRRARREEQARLFPGEVIELNRHVEVSELLAEPIRNIAPSSQNRQMVEMGNRFPPQAVVSQVDSVRGTR